MAYIKDAEDFMDWYEEGRPIPWILALQVRCALRAFALYRSPTDSHRITLGIFRALFAAYNGIFPTKESTQAAKLAANSIIRNVGPATPGGAAFNAALSASGDNSNDILVDVVGGPMPGAIYAASAVFRDWSSDFWRELEADATDLEKSLTGAAAQDLMYKPLWTYSTPIEYLHHWRLFSGMLQKADPSWKIWSDWYESRLSGEPTNFEIGIKNDIFLIKKILLQEEKFWRRSPVLINTEINSWLLDFLPSLPQDKSSLRFQTGEDRLIRFAPIDDDDKLRSTPQLIDKYAEFKKSFDRIKRCSPNELGDELPEMIADFDEVFPTEVEDINVHLFWPRFNRLRKLLRRHLAALHSPDLAHDRLNGSVPSRLEEVVENGNIFIFGQSQFSDKDTEALGPQDKNALAQAYVGVREIVLDTAANADVTDKITGKEVLKAVKDGEDATAEPTAILGRQEAQRIQRNFLTEMVNKFRDDTKSIRNGFLEGGASYAGEEFAKFMWENRDSIIAFFTSQAPEWLKFVQDLFELIGRFM